MSSNSNHGSGSKLEDLITRLDRSTTDRVSEIKQELVAFEKEQLAGLRHALEHAKAKILEQQETIGQLANPPLPYATVIAVAPVEFVQKERYQVVNGEILRVDPTIKSMGRFKLGDVLEFEPSAVRDEIRRAKTHVVVAFESSGNMWTLHDDLFVARGSSDMSYAKVIGNLSDHGCAVVMVDGKFYEVSCPKDVKIQPGDTVTVSPETMQIVGLAKVQVAGAVAYVRRVIDEEFSEVDFESSIRVVFNGRYAKSLDKGDRVVLDATGTVVVRSLGKDEERFSFTAETNVTWDDIGGLADAKRQIIEAVELPHTHAKAFAFYRKKPIKGILLDGPPGCGKTMLGKATATSISRAHKKEARPTGFIYIKGPEILDRFVGVAEATVRQIFQRARKHKEAHGYPAVVFIDEADAILMKRGSGISSDVERTIVPMFLTEMDGLEESGALVILATNRPDILDPAIVRDGRIDRKITVGRPTPESTKEIFLLNLKGMPLNNGYTYEELASLGSDEVFSSRRVLYEVTTRNQGTLQFTLGHIINGGMVAGIVDQATSIAMHRDLSKKKPEGLCRDDLVAAVDAVERQNRGLNHTDELAEFVRDFRDEVVEVQRLRQATA